MFLLPVDDEVELRLTVDAHADRLFALTDAERERLREWLPWVDATQTLTDTRAWLRGTLDDLAAGRAYHSTIFVDGVAMGTLGLFGLEHRHGEIGYWLSREVEGRGVMTRAVRALVDRAVTDLNLHRLSIRAATGNLRSRAVAERLGFTHEATLREVEWVNDRFVDHEVYILLAGDQPAGSRPTRAGSRTGRRAGGRTRSG